MFSCWRLSPKDRPGFGALRGALEQALQQIPEQDEDLLYVNMEEPGTLLGAVGGWEPSGPPLASWRRGCQAAGEPQAGRYVLGPLRQVQPPSLDESQDSLSWMWSSSNTTLQLQASPSCSPPSSLTLAGQEGEEGRAASRK